jgi:hypothetical protein
MVEHLDGCLSHPFYRQGIRTNIAFVMFASYEPGYHRCKLQSLHRLNIPSPDSSNPKVIPLVSPDWPLSVMSSFLARYFRRTLHAKHERRVVKAISEGQNLEVRIPIVSCQMYAFAHDCFAFVVVRWLTALGSSFGNKAPSSKRPTRMRATRVIVAQKANSTRSDVLPEKVALHLQDIDKISVWVEEWTSQIWKVMMKESGKKFSRDDQRRIRMR